MNNKSSINRNRVLALVFDIAIIVVCATAAYRTGDWGYLLVATGVVALSFVWFQNPVALNKTISLQTEVKRPVNVALIAITLIGFVFVAAGAIKILF